MLHFQPILYVVGMLLSIMAFGMCVPAAVDLYFGNRGWQVFATSAGLTLFIGIGLALTNHAPQIRLTVRQAFVLTTLSWACSPFLRRCRSAFPS